MILFAGVAGGGAGYQLIRHLPPDSWLRSIMGGLAHLAGQQATPQVQAIIAAGIGLALGIAAEMVIGDYFHGRKKQRAALKMMRDARELERIEAKLAAKQVRTGKMDRQTLKAVAGNFTQPETPPDRATPGFIAACVIGFAIVFLLAAHILL